jgi:hypothetical protein
MSFQHILCMGSPAALAFAAALTSSSEALAWGNEGHETVALIARHYIDQTPGLSAKVDAILSGPKDPDVGPDFATLGTWADQYRQSSAARKQATRQWHFVDVELDDSNDKAAACFGNALPASAPAFPGIPKDCVVNKIDQFERELKAPTTTPEERELALLFLLHFVGDVHQPLHAADNHDQGGNEVYVVTGKGRYGTNLHSYWDTYVVSRLGRSPTTVANTLIAGITPANVTAWTSATPGNDTWTWADESLAIAKQAYARLPKKTRACKIKKDPHGPPINERCIVISKAYTTWATGQARRQLQKAGVRLASVIEDALQ